ncbi:MAG: glycosyltransferase family 39 protein, partial [Ktedonobacteraceae bacterium]
MADNLHNFFFVSYDPGGFVSVDKPPLGFWLQALSVKVFGFTPFSIFLPQALAGVLSVLLLFYLVRRHFGVTAGLLAGLALALSPLSVATDRNNTIDSTLALTLLLGAWAVLRATETGRWRWLLLSAALVGIGFNIKMAEAYLVIPAFGLLYLLAAPRSLWMRLTQLSLALLLLLAISLSWATAVDLIPASQRPYVGSSQNNSEISLAFGYNGIDRVLGNLGFNRGNHDTTDETHRAASTNTSQSTLPDKTTASAPETHDPVNTGQHLQGNFARFYTNTPGPLRLLNEPLGGQIAWFLPIALLGILALAWQRRPRFRQDRQQQSLLLWGIWLLTTVVFFSSIPGFFHQYYMVTFVPTICALFGIGLVIMWHDYQRPGWRGWLLPLALFVTACEQINIINSNPAWGAWLIPLIAIPCVLAALTLSMARLLTYFDLNNIRPFARLNLDEPYIPVHLDHNEARLCTYLDRKAINSRVLGPALALGLAALLLTPAIWSVMPALQKTGEHAPS